MAEKRPHRMTKLGEYRARLYKKITWVIYIVECADGTYYGGMVQDLEEQLHFINNDRKGFYFNTHPERVPVMLRYEENIPFKEAHAKFKYLRKMNKRLKKKLIETKRWPYGGTWKVFAENNPHYLKNKNIDSFKPKNYYLEMNTLNRVDDKV